MGIILCILAFTAAAFCGSQSLTLGLRAVLTVGYLYGILRANYLDGFSHLIFDCAVLGLYVTAFTRQESERAEVRPVRNWLLALLAWPLLVLLIPVHHPLIQLVGLRGNALLLPFLLLGARLRNEEVFPIAIWLGVLNIGAFVVGVAEFLLGVERFFPRNAVTDIIYKSNDIANYTAYRIPATFINAHAYAGTMVVTLPWLVGAWLQPTRSLLSRGLLNIALPVTVIAVFMAGPRFPVVLFGIILVGASLSGELRRSAFIGWAVMLVAVGYVISSEARFQRFLTLLDTDMVAERIRGSVNQGFFDLLEQYPLGNGLCGGGTSVPYFLQQYAPETVGLENEWSRILLEQGIPGVLLWAAFILWFCLRPPAGSGNPLALARRLLWYYCVALFLTMALGVGMLTSIPQSALFLFSVGWVVAQPARLPRSGRAPAPPATLVRQPPFTQAGVGG